jgi:hypothetical protein
MVEFKSRLEDIQDQFNGFPSKSPIVRMNQKNDSFVILVFEILFYSFHEISKFKRDNDHHLEILQKSIVPPPDDGIDIFFEEKNLDETKYHIVQVKNCSLDPSGIKKCFLEMKDTTSKLKKKPNVVANNLKKLAAETDFNTSTKNDCIYYLVHTGSTKFIKDQKNNENIITGSDLLLLHNGTKKMMVPKEIFEIDTVNNFIVNNFVKDENGNKNFNKNLPQSILCNLSGYDLAKLNNKYSNSLLGSNILYGQNLRESLSKYSKTYKPMFDTIDNEPDLFLFYNNGITIISSFSDPKTDQKDKKDKITVENFSIINGAQTTSTLGAYLKEAEVNLETDKIENLKKVFVLTKIYQINDDLPNHKVISERIKIFNNTQTPLSSRDMVSIREEQIQLQKKLLNGEKPNIFLFIKKGENPPANPQTLKYQRVQNEVLAQLALCAYFSEPFTAKDKKTKIFETDGQPDTLLNNIYQKLFDQKEGVLFTKSKREIDELLFIYMLHEDAKRFQKNFLKEQIKLLHHKPAATEREKIYKEQQIETNNRNSEIVNVCLFYNITCYYSFKNNFDELLPNGNNFSFNAKEYYNNKEYKNNLIKNFLELFYNRTIEIIRRNSGGGNINNWVRAEKSEKIFLDEIRNILSNEGAILSEKYIKFVEEFKS